MSLCSTISSWVGDWPSEKICVFLVYSYAQHYFTVLAVVAIFTINAHLYIVKKVTYLKQSQNIILLLVEFNKKVKMPNV